MISSLYIYSLFLAIISAEDLFIPQFEDAAAKASLNFIHNAGHPEKDYILEVNGAGTALFDYDNDGDLDIYLVNGSWLQLPEGKEPPFDKLFRNDGNWKFTDVTHEAGLGCTEWGCAAGVADYDNDGDLDLYVTNWGPNYFYRNNGNGTFTEIAEQAGVKQTLWGGSCVFGDYDLDGYLDLYVTNYLDFDPEVIPKRGGSDGVLLAGEIPVHAGPGGLTPVPDTLYHNNGDGTFTNVSESSGILEVEPAFGLGVLFIDMDLDGWPDIYVTNDRFCNYLFHNQGDGTFLESGLLFGVSYSETGMAQSGMGVDCADLSGDNLEDIVVLNYAQDYNTLYRNEGDGFFSDVTKEANLYFDSFDQLSWALVVLDVDFDGDQDIFVANGHVMPQVDQTNPKQGYKQTNQLLLNNGQGKFKDVSSQAGEVFKVKYSSRGCAYGDLDEDGDQDMVVNNMDAPPTIYENLGGSGNHWVGIKLIGTQCNRDAIGSWITVKTANKEYKRFVRGGGVGYASHSEMTVRFGLGKTAMIDELIVQWPGGGVESFMIDEVDKIYILTQGEGEG